MLQLMLKFQFCLSGANNPTLGAVKICDEWGGRQKRRIPFSLQKIEVSKQKSHFYNLTARIEIMGTDSRGTP